MTDHPPTIDPARHALFLDFDGTLAPIVARPEDARMPPQTRATLGALARRMDGAVAIVSGRALADLEPLLDGLDVALSGSHGHEIRMPGEETGEVPPLAEPLRAALGHLESLARSQNLRLEVKPGAITLHYRGMPHLEDMVRDEVRETAEAHAGLKPMHGNMVSEVVLDGVGKGAALRTFLSHAPFAGRRPVMIGDDVTDEDGFRAAHALGGFGIKIGVAETEAAFRLGDVPALADWLSALATRSPG
ncbi:trehalose-phosphatase [Roseivivax isoporae]|uniref:Trehalose 6-phosphate phosphatase n=1 Tax=Roseivivax isoporae LMG 25204 TaxID=1449351 RepID=X7FA10_9RHOB|nr:trehalose-phosphatase [Roseivivax isoporae]ETX28946.1 hypothetical protein RISW2_04325 [Roseivivax isoporae LMG 25204]